ncbi:MAG TPA: LCP family protein [Mycobacteriales bacterium]
MIEDELAAAFVRHESLVPSARELAPRVARTVRRRRSRRVAARVSAAALTVAAVALVPVLAGFTGGRGHVTGNPDSRPSAVPAATTPARNLLVVGSDERPDLPGSGRADTIILVHLDRGGRRAYLVSLPRDTLVPGGSCGPGQPGELLCPLLRGGPEAEAEAVSRLTGVRIDGVVSVRFGGLVALVDAVGGVDLTVDREVRSRDTHRVFRTGRQHLTGTQALDYVRQRYDLANGDLDRQRHQQELLAALLDRATSLGVLANPARLEALLRAAGDAVTVSPDGFDLVALGRQYPGLRTGSLVGLTVPCHLAVHDSAQGPVMTYDLDPGATDLFGAIAADRIAPFVAGHPELVWLKP